MAAGAVDRAFAVLELLASHPAGLPLREIAESADIPKSATHRLLASLAARRYVRPDGETGRSRMGLETPLASTAAGHAWLACLTDEQALELVARQGFRPSPTQGPNAPRTIDALLARLRAARKRGYAWVVESSAPGMAAMAAAVRHPVTGGVVGVVSVAGPSVRLTEARMHELAPVMLAAASELSDACKSSEYFAAASRSTARHRATPGE